MKVKITDTFYVKIDSIGNHQPYYFREGGDTITIGKFQGQETKDKWVYADKYFNNVSRAILWGIEEGLVEGGEKLLGEDEIDAQAYLGRLEHNTKALEKILKENRK